jgi:hypothetical protein
VPGDCVILGLVVPDRLQVGQTAAVGAYQESCRPMFLPLDPNQLTWSSLDPTIAAVSASGVIGLAPGVAVVQGTYGSMSAQALLSVGDPQPGPATPLRLRLIGSPAMRAGQRARFGAFVEFANGTAGNVTSAAAWRSSDSSVALIGERSAEANFVYALKAGSSTMTITYQGMTAVMTVTASP